MPTLTKKEPIIDLSQLKTHSLNSLVDIFQQISQHDSVTKHLLVLDKSLSKYINRLTPFSNLKSMTNIDKVVWLEQNIDVTVLEQFKSVVFLSKDTLPDIELISSITKTKILPMDKHIRLSAIFASSNEKFDNLMVESLNLKGDMDVYNWPKMVPVLLAPDLLSMDNDLDLKHLYQFQSISSITRLSETLLDLIVMSNYKLRITHTYVKGELSQKFLHDFNKTFDVYKNTMTPKERKLFDDTDDCLFLDKHTFYNKQCDLVVLERSVDLISPLLTQLTYMGLIDEYFDIDLDEIEVVVPTEESSHSKTKIRLDDVLFETELKDLNFSQVGPILNKKAKFLQEEFESRHNAKDIKQIKSFVDKLNELTEQQKLVKTHTLIAETILKKVKGGGTSQQQQQSIEGEEVDEDAEEDTYFNQLIDLQQQILSNNYDNTTNCSKLLDFLYVYKPSFNDFLKLVVLTNIVKKGIRYKEYHTLQKEIIENYGFEAFPVLRTLNELKLFNVREGTGDNFTSLFSSSEIATAEISAQLHQHRFNPSAQLIKDFSQANYFLNLIPTDAEEGKDPDFVLPGYVPIIARLVQSIYSRDFSPSSALKVQARKPGWRKLNENLGKYFHGGEFKESVLVPDNKKFIFEQGDPAAGGGNKSHREKEEEYIIVVMIGGITYAELASLRFVIDRINRDKGYNKKLLVLTNNVIKSDDIIKMSK